MAPSAEAKPARRPTLRISTSLNPAVLPLSRPLYPTITLTVALTLHDADQPLTVCTRGGILDPKRYTARASPFALVSVRTRERADRSTTVARITSGNDDDDMVLDAREDLVTVHSGGGGGAAPLVREFSFSGYDGTRTRPVGPGERETGAEDWLIGGTALSALRVEEEYELEVLCGAHYCLFRWYEWGDLDEVVRRRVGRLARALGGRRFSTRPRYLGGRDRGEAGEDLGWEEWEKGRIALVE